MPQGFNVTDFRTGFTAHRLVHVDRFFLLFVFDTPDDTVQRHRPPSWPFSMSRLCSPQAVYSRPPPSTWSLHILACLLSPRHRSRLPHYVETAEPWRNSLVFLGVLVCHLGSITAASGRLPSFRLPNRGDIVVAGVFGVCLSSLDSTRLLSFRRPNCGDLVSFGLVQSVPPSTIADSVRLHSGCRIVVIV